MGILGVTADPKGSNSRRNYENTLNHIKIQRHNNRHLTLLKSIRRDKFKSYEETILRLTKDIVTSPRISR